MPSFYSTWKAFKGDPKNLAQLRNVEHHKLKELRGGEFAFTMEAEDGGPVLMVWWGNHGNNVSNPKDSWKTLVKAKTWIQGLLTCNAKLKEWEFRIHESFGEQKKKYLKLADFAFSIAMWNLIGPGHANTIKIDGVAVNRRSLNDLTFPLYENDLIRTLVTNDDAPLAVAQATQRKGVKGYRLPSGLLLPGTLPIKVSATGKMADAAAKNETMWARIQDPLGSIVRAECKDLATKLLELDGKLAKKRDKRDEIVQQANQVLESFFDEVNRKLDQSAEQKWLEALEAKIDFRDFEIDMAVKITKGTVTFAIGVTVAAVGGISGVGAILGLIGTIKGGLETAESVYTTFRGADGLSKELNVTIANALKHKYEAGWQDFAKTALANLPGGKVVQAGLARQGLAVKPVKGIKEDLTAYNAKVSEMLNKALELGKTANLVVDKSSAALAALDTPEVREIEAQDPKLQKRNEKLRKKLGEATTAYLDRIAKLSQRFDEGKVNHKKYTELVGQLEREVEKNVLAKVLKDVFTPLLNLPWGVDPDNMASTILSVAAVTTEALNPVIEELKVSGELPEMLKTGLDVASGIAGVVDAVNKAK